MQLILVNNSDLAQLYWTVSVTKYQMSFAHKVLYQVKRSVTN